MSIAGSDAACDDGNEVLADADITRSAEQVLAWTSLVPVEHVKVMDEKGHITLSDNVDCTSGAWLRPAFASSWASPVSPA